MSWKAKYPQRAATPKKVKTCLMVKPTVEICEWLAKEALKRDVEVHQIIEAMLEEFYERDFLINQRSSNENTK